MTSSQLNFKNALAAWLFVAILRCSAAPTEYSALDIGGASGGATAPVAGGFDITATGRDIGGASDQFHFAYQQRTGDFDMRARVAGLVISDPFVQAGLAVRESLEPNARFAGIFTSSAQLGCFFESRSTLGGQSQAVTTPEGFPPNYPNGWLRLRRSGDQLTGYASFDGVAWQELGTTTLAFPQNVFFGMAAASHSTNAPTTAKFRDLSPSLNPTTLNYVSTREPLGPSSRRTGLVFSEIMYHPPSRADERNLEFIEIYNGESIFVDLTGWRLAGAVNYSFPNGFKLQAGEFAVIAADRAALESVYGLRGVLGVLGPYNGRLNNASETLRLVSPAGAIRLEVEYSPNPPWPVAADGAGHSLVLARPSFGENDPRAWAGSDRVGGSPGEVDALWPNPWRGVVINEFLSHTDDPDLDFIELYNASSSSIDVSDCWLSDSSATNKFRIPQGTLLPARGFIVFNQNQLGFALNSAGETIYFLNPDQSRVLDAIRFRGQENGVSSGRSPDGAPTVRRLSSKTPGAANGPWRIEDIVINEIMFHPISRDDADEYVELHNRSAAAVNLAGWRFSAGIDYEFPTGASIPAGGYVVVASDGERLRGKYPQLNAANTFGNFKGNLRDSGERLALAKPDQVLSTNRIGLLVTNTIHIDVSEVTFVDGGRWSELADGGGSSLELIDPRADGLRASNWAASDETQKAPWSSFEFTGPLSLGVSTPAANRFQILMLGAGECLVDDVEIFRVGSTNLLANGGFENGSTGWTFLGHHSRSSIESTGAASGQNALHVRAPGDGDTANNSIRANLTTALTAGQTATIRAKVRWLSGWPEVLFRVRGNWIEFPVRMELPKNLGTPGLANSRRVNNASPAIFDVKHSPALPRANEAVVVTCRVSDPDGIAPPRLRFRVDPSTTLSTVFMNDDGQGADALAGDGIYSATIAGRAASTRVAFRIEATDDSPSPASPSVFPATAPERECLIRWGETIPFGTFGHYHLWSTDATEQARNASRPLNNTYRDCTLVYGNFRIIYNAGFRDKGSPYHGGSGDFAVTVPQDDLLLGSEDRVFGSTGNGGSESTGMRGDVSAWIASQMGIPYLHSHFVRLYRNGTRFRDVIYDMEQPNRDYARSWFGGDTPTDDLYKIAVWFEFQDDNSTFQATSATLERFLTGNSYRLARYRWNWQLRPGTDTANNYSSLFNLVTAANSTSDRVNRLLGAADMEQWMRIFAFNRVVGNWDSWTFNVGQNMYMYIPTGGRATLMPWDIDFVLGDGNGTTDALWGGQDPVGSQLHILPAFRRMLWRAYQDAINGPMLPENYNPQIDSRRSVLLKNGLTSLADPRPLKTYLDGRRSYLVRQLQSADTQVFALTNPSADFTTGNAVTTLAGTAPFAVASIEINGIPYPINWTGFTNWQISVPLGAATNALKLVGRDLRGNAVAGANAQITIRYTGAVPQPQDWVVINEIMYNPAVKDAEFVELYNQHPSVSFNLSGFALSGLGFTFPAGAFIAPNGFVVIAKDRAAFANAYGPAISVAGEFSASFDKGGETLRLVKPGATEVEDVTLDDVRYDDDAPWPLNADGLGSSLQLIDPAQDNWRVGNWAATSTNDLNRATPGRSNATRNFVEPFPALWINEVLPNNRSGVPDNQNEREPWIEFHNAGSSPLDLSSYFVSNDPNELTKWQFPPGTSLGAGQYLVLWADGETAESTSSALHTNFRLNPTNGIVTISRLQLGAAAAMDYLNYAAASPDQSFGSFPNGDPRKRRLLYIPTIGAPNNPIVPTVPVFINEWMASNRSTLVDPADRQLDDWFELYNAGSTNVDLSGFYLSNDPSDHTMFPIPAGTTLGPRGFRLFWADNEIAQNATGRDLHTNFRLPAEGGQIGLYAPDGNLVDSVTFAVQTPDISEGRLPDGGEPPFLSFALATPGAANSGQTANRPPVVGAINDKSVSEGQSLAFRIQASDPETSQVLSFSLSAAPPGAKINSGTGDFEWTPSEEQGPGGFQVTVRVTDNGVPARSTSRSFLINVAEVNAPPALSSIADQTIDEGSLFTFQSIATDPDLPTQKLTFSLEPGAPAGSGVDPVTGEFSWLPAEADGPGTYRVSVRVTDGGTPALSAVRTFNIAVREINNPPVITPVSPQSVDERATLTLQIEARDSDNPPAKLSYALENAPAGATINSDTGVFVWTPSEADGPRDYNVTVLVSEPGGSPSATMSFLIGVREVNTVPALAPIPDFVVTEGALINFTNRASDLDLPAQTLTFSSVTPLPKGANLDATTGIFTWLVPEDAPGGTNLITIRAADDAAPSLAAEQTFRVVIQVPWRVAISEIHHRSTAANAEFVEIANYSANTPIDISGWRLEGYNFTFPTGTILEPNGFLCVAKDLNAFRSAYGAKPPALGNASVSLAADGGLLRLVKPPIGDGPEEVVDEVQFSLRAPWPPAAANSASLQVIDLREDNRRAGNWAASTGVVTNTTLNAVPMTATWRFWQNASNPGSAWNSLTFNDSSWPSGPALLYVETAALPAPKSTALTVGSTTYYFRTRFNFSGNPSGAQLRLQTIMDDGAVYYLNGQEFFRLGMPAGAVTQTTFANRTVGDAALEGVFDNPAVGLRTGENVLAVEVHQVNATSSDIVFGAQIDLVTVAASPFTPGAANSVSADLPPFPAIWINEILPNNTSGLVDNAGEREPWIELYNASDAAVRLDDWSLSDDYGVLGKWIFPAGTTLPARGFLLVWADGEAAESSPGNLHTSFRIPTSSGSVALARPQNAGRAVVDYVNYSVSAPDQSFGSTLDGQPFLRGVLNAPSGGAANQVTPSGPLLQASLQVDGKVRFTWPSKVGVRYRLQAAPTLTNPSWQTIFEAVAGETSSSFLDPITASQPQRYYRLLID